MRIPTYQEFGEVVKYAHKHGVKVFLMMNIPFVIGDMERYMKNHIRCCLDKGIDALIIGNMGVLSIVKEMQVYIPLIAGTLKGNPFLIFSQFLLGFLRSSN